MTSWRRPALLIFGSGPAALCVCAALVTGAAELLGSDGAEQYCLLPLSLLLYSKLGREKILDNFLRGKIYGFVLANPGESQNHMMARLDIPHGTLLYHLERLERERLVKSRPDGALKRYYPAAFEVPERLRSRRGLAGHLPEGHRRHPRGQHGGGEPSSRGPSREECSPTRARRAGLPVLRGDRR
jgi:DNA-binding transcriptional ArsR family regulator